MAKKTAKQPEKSQADYYKLHTEAADRLVNTTAENAPRYSREELNRYKGGKKSWRFPETLKVLLIKFWFYGAICYFVFMGLGMYIPALLDMFFVAGVVTGMVTDLLVNHFLRFTEQMPGGSKHWMMVTKRGTGGFILNILYGLLLMFLVISLYYGINAFLQPDNTQGVAVVLVEPLLFGVLTTALDMACVGLKRGFMKIVADAKEKVDNGR